MFMEVNPVYGLGLIAGTLSILSPCVLPIVPLLVGSATTAHRLGPLALAGGLTLSFTLVGVFIFSIGSAIGLDQQLFRNVAAVLLIIFGLMLISSVLQEKFAAAISGFSGSGQSFSTRFSTDSLSGQFVLGLLMGIIWSPCVGPTLGATIVLASQGQDLMHVTAMMALFGLGAGIPLILLGLLSRQAMLKYRNQLFHAGKWGKRILGALLLILGLLIISGMDKPLEKKLLDHSPDWLTDLSTSI
jgi:cytochrome c-type biogenesis protein